MPWSEILGPLKQEPYFKQALNAVAQARAQGLEVYPQDADLFNAFRYTPLESLKVVIIGQDPYHEPNQAMGLSFAVPVGVQVPPSLVNIYKELSKELPDFVIPNHGNLIPWARQGVLLLNASLSVIRGEPNSMSRVGWQEFTTEVIRAVNQHCEHLVFMLWGKNAQEKGAGVDPNRHLVLTSAHPSPLSASRGFFGCGHFVKANEYLKAQGKKPIDWRLPEFLDGSEEL
ncbi:MAG: uracil-DNA glycosylase [Succinivibrio sp.]|nr:uracil-DNA glycosylase [Succinivibrio sp.]